MQKSTKEMNKTASFFQKYIFIASKSTFEFNSRHKDVQESHLKQNKQFLEQTQAIRLNGTPLPTRLIKTWKKTKVKEKLVSDNSHSQLIHNNFSMHLPCKLSGLYCSHMNTIEVSHCVTLFLKVLSGPIKACG